MDDHDRLILLIAKIISMVCIFLFSVLFGIAPLFCRKCVKSEKVQWSTNAVICFSGGILLGISFLHLMPETRESVRILKSEGYFKSFPVHVSLADTIICVGFFFIYVLDEVIHLLLEWGGEDHYHQPHGLREPNQDAFNFVQEDKSSVKSLEGRDTKDEATSTTEAEVNINIQHLNLTNPRIHIPSILTIIAMSFHDVFEGLALGVQGHVTGTIFMFLSIATHKYAISFSVSLDLLLSGLSGKMICVYTLCFSLVNPLGIGFGILSDLISHEEHVQSSPMIVLMQGVASGSLIYVTCFEVLQRHGSSSSHVSGIRNTMFVIMGFIFILMLKIFMTYEHESMLKNKDELH